jgi:hypothetical protein
MLARDAGLSRISTVTRWTIAGVVALSGALAVVADRAFHGHSVSDASASSTATQPPASGTPAAGSPSSLQPPAQTPVQTPAAPVVTSGGS